MSEEIELTKKQKEMLQRLTDEILDLSVEITQDYENNPSKISGSIVRIHEDSDFLTGSLDDY